MPEGKCSEERIGTQKVCQITSTATVLIFQWFQLASVVDSNWSLAHFSVSVIAFKISTCSSNNCLWVYER